MPLHQLLDRAGSPDQQVMVSGMQLDSRLVEEGDVFLALPGEMHDGRQFIEQAVANGASAVIAEAPVAGFVDEIPVPLVEVPELRQEAGPGYWHHRRQWQEHDQSAICPTRPGRG